MRRIHFASLMCLIAVPVGAEGLAQSTMVATLLPPPVEALKALPAANNMVSVPVLKQPVQKGETIQADNVMMQEIPTSQAFASTITSMDELVGQQAVRPLGAATPVNRLHVKVAALVSRNQLVIMIYRKGGIELSGRAQALEDGQAGQTIRLINPATRSSITGTVTRDGSVEVN
ncbi:MAG: flagella basal body P-ring formation protein FlgA [Pseudomonas fluorescens]|nr:MAG: flagella basal body P-ring formation protein FlgA [Pseudomonas fluorescens]